MGLPLPVVVEETATLTSATLLLHDSPAPGVKGVIVCNESQMSHQYECRDTM